LTTYHVRHNRGRWKVLKLGNERASSTASKKSKAVKKATKLAKKNKPSSVVIHRKNNTVQDTRSYGRQRRAR